MRPVLPISRVSVIIMCVTFWSPRAAGRCAEVITIVSVSVMTMPAIAAI
eukprot:XP_001705376.1 Hypothetical protein GL50803_35228 [Giardia lamblia ATCC 50803]